jgi:hypothetical protein
MQVPAGFFVTHDGTLCRDVPAAPIVRERYAFTYRFITSGAQLRATLRAGAFAWPGGYQMFLLTSDGGALCFTCAERELRQITRAIRGRLSDGWRVTGCDVNWEDASLTCDHCNACIPSAYFTRDERA